MLKILQARLQQYMNWKFPDAQAGFRRGKGTKDQFANKCWITEKSREFQKNIYLIFIDYAIKTLTVWITTNCGNFFKRWEYQTTWPASWEHCIQVKKQQLEPGIEQQTGWKLGKEYFKAVYCHPAYLTYVQSTSGKRQAGWSTSWNQDCWEKYNNLRYADDTILTAESKEKLKSLLIKMKEKKWLKIQHSKN